jgi:lipoprotein-anchoring transpeptidase ErfK/SrfK
MVALTLVTVGMLTATGLIAGEPTRSVSTVRPPALPSAPAPVPFSLKISPTDHARRLAVSAEIRIRVTGGDVTRVAVTGRRGRVAGALREDHSSWVPARPLDFAASYAATVIATSADGSQVATRATRFTTMARPALETGTGLYLFSGERYGVAMPVVVEFDPPVPAGARAGVQRRLFVHSTPPQPGVWSWVDGRQTLYRPPRYWLPGTLLKVRTALGGHPMGGGRYGDTDRSATVRIARSIRLVIDNRTKKMNVYHGVRLLRRIPVSLGKPSTPSSSGRLVIMSKESSTIFDTTREGPGGYRIRISYAQRLTWGGEFIHAAPWSVGDQGRRNVSHGCVNVSWENARWLFGVTHVGDPVLVRGTGVRVGPGNGWTVWNMPWSRFVKGSALPAS